MQQSIVQYLFKINCYDYKGFKSDFILTCTRNHSLQEIVGEVDKKCGWYSGTTLYYNNCGVLIPFDSWNFEGDWCGIPVVILLNCMHLIFQQIQ